MTVRPAEARDVPELARVHIASWRAAYGHLLPAGVLDGLSRDEFEARWRRAIADDGPRRTNLVAEAGGVVVGFVAFGTSRDADTDPAVTGELLAFYVDPAHWGGGHGRALCDAALAALRGRGVRDVILWVYEENRRARAFYERAGFAHEPDQRRFVERFGSAPAEVRYRKSLGPAPLPTP